MVWFWFGNLLKKGPDAPSKQQQQQSN